MSWIMSIVIMIIIIIIIIIVVVVVVVVVIIIVLLLLLLLLSIIVLILIACATGEDNSGVSEVHTQHHNLTAEAGVLVQMRSLSGRRKVPHLFINLTRWLHTVHTLCLLPPPPPARLLEPFFWRAPYDGERQSLSYDAVFLQLANVRSE